MNRFALTAILAVGLVGVAQADLYTFSFDNPLPLNTGVAGIESYMEGVYGSDITVWSGDADDKLIVNTAPLHNGAGDRWVKVNGGAGSSTPDGISFSFNDAPIISVSFDWARAKNNNAFIAEADGTEFFRNDEAITAITSGYFSYTFADPVTALYFHDHGSGWIGVDNLAVQTPIPAGLLLGVLGLGTAGIRLRRFV